MRWPATWVLEKTNSIPYTDLMQILDSAPIKKGAIMSNIKRFIQVFIYSWKNAWAITRLSKRREK